MKLTEPEGPEMKRGRLGRPLRCIGGTLPLSRHAGAFAPSRSGEPLQGVSRNLVENTVATTSRKGNIWNPTSVRLNNCPRTTLFGAQDERMLTSPIAPAVQLRSRQLTPFRY